MRLTGPEGSPEVLTSSGYGSYGYKTGSSNKTRYKTVNDPQDSFSITCSPNVQVTGAGVAGPPIKGGSAYGSLNYKAFASPLEIELSGGIGPKDAKQYLVGQQVTAYLQTGGFTPTSRNWGVSGGDPFKAYTASNQVAEYTGLGAETGSSLVFRFKTEALQNNRPSVSCTVNLAVPSGAKPVAGLTATLSKKCSVVAPENTLDTQIGNVQVGPSANPEWLRLFGVQSVDDYGTPYYVGIIWTGKVITPTNFQQAYGGEAGGWNFTQIAKPGRTMTYDNGVDPALQRHMAQNGWWLLDGSFGYAPHYPALYTAIDNEQWSSDLPKQNAVGPHKEISVDDHFVLYTMYKPPGDGSCFVPLQNNKWFWKGETERNLLGSPQLVIGTGEADVEGWEVTPDHPEWDEAVDPDYWLPEVP